MSTINLSFAVNERETAWQTMIICVCRAISESELENAIDNGTLRDFFASRGTVPDCGLCIKLLEERIRNYKKFLKHK